MKITTEIQLGSDMQAIYLVDNNDYPTLIAHSRMHNLGETLCGLYYAHYCDTIAIAGPRDITSKIADDAVTVSKEHYAERPALHIEIV